MKPIVRFTARNFGGYTLMLVMTGLLIGNIDIDNFFLINTALLMGSIITFLWATHYYREDNIKDGDI